MLCLFVFVIQIYKFIVRVGRYLRKMSSTPKFKSPPEFIFQSENSESSKFMSVKTRLGANVEVHNHTQIKRSQESSMLVGD